VDIAKPYAIAVNDVDFGYVNQAGLLFNAFNLKVDQGKRFGLFGPNGAGKTTLMSLMTGLIPFSKGNILLSGTPINAGGKAVNKIFGYVPQDFSFYQELSPVENLEFYGAWYGLKNPQIKSRISELMQILDLEEVKDKKVQLFSGGMKRRVNLAIGVMHNPQILFLDEPTVGVDVQTRLAIISYLKHINEQGTTLIYTSHQLSEAEDLCNEVALINHGRIIAQDTLDTLLSRHNTNNLEELFITLTTNKPR
jgi:ABC-2 type transport system ATP-binding protein